MTARIYLALICQIALTQSVLSTETASCSADGDPKCIQSELGSADDAQVLLQSQKMKVSQHLDSDKPPSEFKFRVRPADYELSMTMTAVVMMGGNFVGNGDLIVFVGNETHRKVQGLATAKDDFPLGPYAGKPIYLTMIYGYGPHDDAFPPSSGQAITFAWLSHSGELEDLKLKGDPITFQSNANLGSALAPMVLEKAAGAPSMLLQVPGPNRKPSFSVNPYSYELSMTMTTVVKINGEVRADGDLCALVGGKLQGLQSNTLNDFPFGPYANKAVYHLMVYGHATTPESKKDLTFIWLSHAGELIRLESVTPPKAEKFQSDGILGNALNPVVLTPMTPPPEQVCADAPKADFDSFMRNTYGFAPGSSTCANWKGWNACGYVNGMCDKTCGKCS